MNHEAFRRCLPVASAVTLRTKAVCIAEAKRIALAYTNDVAVAIGPTPRRNGAEGVYREEFISRDGLKVERYKAPQ